MSKMFDFKIRLLSDLHSGTGKTGDVIDGVQMTDRHGNAVIRESHLRGLLRDSGAEIARLSSDPEDADRQRALFGEGGPNARRRIVVTTLRSRSGASGMTRSTSTARRPGDRGPAEDTLRSRELVSTGTEFEACIELIDPGLEPFLRDAVRRTTHLGARRARGDGRILVTLFDEAERPDRGTSRLTNPPAAGALRLSLLLRAIDPVCLPVTSAPENVIPTECYARGQTLAGAFISWLLARGKPAGWLLEGAEAPAFGPGYPLPHKTGRTGKDLASSWEVVPVPLDATRRKPGPANAPDWPWWAEDGGTVDSEGVADKRPGDREFLYRSEPDADWTLFTVPIHRHMRNDSGVHRRRLDGATLSLYSREEIPEETDFLAQIDFPDLASAERFSAAFEDLLAGRSWLTLGRGGAPVEVLSGVFFDQPVAFEPSAQNSSLRIDLTTDLIARDHLLNFHEELGPALFADLAGQGDAAINSLKEKMKNGWSYHAAQDIISIHGFNASSGLPRLPARAFRRGSTITMRGPSDEVNQLATTLKARGSLGERTREGFGRFRLSSEQRSGSDDPEDIFATAPPPAKREEEVHRARQIQKKLRKMRSSSPARSQWHALAERFRRAEDIGKLREALDELEEHSTRIAGQAWNEINCTLFSAEIENFDARINEGNADLRDLKFRLDLIIGLEIRQLEREGDEK